MKVKVVFEGGTPVSISVHDGEHDGFAWWDVKDNVAVYDGSVHGIDRDKAESEIKKLPFIDAVERNPGPKR